MYTYPTWLLWTLGPRLWMLLHPHEYIYFKNQLMDFTSILLNMEFTVRQRQDRFKAFGMILSQPRDGATQTPAVQLQTVNLHKPFTIKLIAQ